jgi:hypothetical protein
MNKIVRLVKEISCSAGYGGMSCWTTHLAGSLFYVEPYKHIQGTNSYHPFSGGYCVWDRHVDMESCTELVEETDKPKEYYINKIYSQYDLDKSLKG